MARLAARCSRSRFRASGEGAVTTGSPALALVLGSSAAAAYGTASALQHHAAAQVSPTDETGVGMVRRLASDRVWLAGGLADIAAVAMHAAALWAGSLVVVQTLLPLGIVVALIVGARFDHRLPPAADWGAALTIAVGIGVFLAAARPHGGVQNPSARSWVVAGALLGGLAIASLMAAKRTATQAAATFVAAAAALALAFAAALTSPVLHRFTGGIAHGLGSWLTIALIASGGIGFLLAQRAFQTAPLRVSLPVLTIADPLLGLLLGLFVFRQHIAFEGADGVLIGVGLLAIVAGSARLTRRVDDPRKSPVSVQPR
jgi:hypothetical protein